MMKAIFRKEMKTYFFSVQGYVFIGVFLMICGYYFAAYNVVGENTEIGTMLDNTVISFAFLTPILTMRLFAEEKHMKTDAVYMSAPLKTSQIVLGKYFAACAVFALAVLFSGISSLCVVMHGGQSLGEIFCVYTGYILVGICFIAVGMFVSAMTESQIAAAVISFGICLILYLADWLTEASGSGAAAYVANLIAVAKHYETFLSGTFDLTDVGYFISFAAMFVCFTVMKTEGERY